MGGEKIKTNFLKEFCYEGEGGCETVIGGSRWSPFGFFIVMLECLRDGGNDDQGEGREIQVQSPGGGKTG